VEYHDPFIPTIAHDDWMLESVDDIKEGVSKADCVVIVTDHSTYNYEDILNKATLVVDTRNALG
ncbi:MAG: UDP-N-acetyl-D-glucosamine dehydrogenase, partial [candidate division Zixibacteria bacterium]|nr:UDP-N-acetyl-D-glucosamine dehydrogenase [candidate division Zixibacteria bacterium]NIW44427.1 UDP-N-acetyl-D-glucosamine dehydrogenase [Gammaproteobacteria bacterium]